MQKEMQKKPTCKIVAGRSEVLVANHTLPHSSNKAQQTQSNKQKQKTDKKNTIKRCNQKTTCKIVAGRSEVLVASHTLPRLSLLADGGGPEHDCWSKMY